MVCSLGWVVVVVLGRRPCFRGTHAASSLNHLVCPRQQRRRNRYPEGLANSSSAKPGPPDAGGRLVKPGSRGRDFGLLQL